MLRHSPLPPLVLSSALALGLALTGTRTDATVGAAPAKSDAEAPALRATPAPGRVAAVARAL